METVAEFTSVSPKITVVRLDEGGSKKVEKAQAKRASSSSERLIADAIREVQGLQRKEADIEEKRRQVSFVAIGRLHELRGAATTDAALMENLERKSGIPKRKNTSDYLFVVKAVLRCANIELKPQTASDWSKVLWGLDLENVPADRTKVVEWLCTRDEETGLTGHAKAFAIVESAMGDSSPNVAADARAAKQAEKKQQAWNDYVTPKLDAPLAEITFAEPVAVPGDYVLQLARIDGQQARVIDIVVTDEDEIQRLVRKHRLVA